tara:strand:+ start:23857 stop:25719 length:1863 start_codon:yes stop_codon:yes gene_type:complete
MISKGEVYIISEIGINHNGSIDTALRLIEASVEAGVSAVKFQKRKLENIYSEDILENPNSAEWNFDYLIPLLKEFELSDEEYKEISKKCISLGVDLIITPFDEESATFSSELGVAALKIASADMTDYKLIEKCASFGVPLIISTGMWSEEEIRKCVKHYDTIGFDYTMLLANSTYPTPYESVNLGFLDTLKEIHTSVGYSGHERGTFIPVAAVAKGATVVEKHITFDRKAQGPDHKASMYPAEFKEMVENIRNLERAMGSTKKINQAETLAKEAFAKSAITTVDMKAGQSFSLENIVYKSPGKGIFQHEIDEFLGRQLKRNIKKGEYISKEDFEEIIPIKEWKVPSFSKNWGVKCRFHDYDEYEVVNSPVVEFHCSDTDLDVDFKGKSKHSQLIIHAPEIVDRELVDLCSDNDIVVKNSIEILQKAIDKTLKIAKQFPTAKPKIVMHLGGMSLEHVVGEKPNELMIERSIDNFKRLNFDPSDIDILPENLPPRPWYLGGQWFQYGFMPASDMVKFCEYFDLGMTFDICHAGLYCNHNGISLNDYSREVLPHVKHMHISDASGIDGEGVPIGTGNIKFEEIFNTLKPGDFSWVTEIWSGHLHQGDGTYKSMHQLSKYSSLL